MISAASAMAAANRVPVTAVEDDVRAITANDLKPLECKDINLTDIVIWHSSMAGDRVASLILGSPGNDTILGGGRR